MALASNAMAAVVDFMREWDSPADFVPARTSGSTGTPKEIHLLKADMRTSARATNCFFGITARSVLAIPLSMDYIAGKMMAVRACEAGCRLLELPVSNAVSIPDDVSVDLLAVVPSQVPSILQNGVASRVGNVLVGGAPLTDDLARELAAANPDSFVGYGMTETCSHVALRRVDSPLYRAMPGVTFESDARGCVQVVAPAFSWKRLQTNDIVELHSPTEFRWLGRADNVIISGGLKIHPEQLEAELRQKFPGLPPFYITSQPSERWGSSPVLVVETNRGTTALPGLAELKNALSDPRHAPVALRTVASLPRTSNGKLRRE